MAERYHRGYTVGNSVLSSEIGGEHFFENVRYNPACFGMGENVIRPVGYADISVCAGEDKYDIGALSPAENTYPLFVSGKKTFDDGTSLCIEAFAPVTPGRSEDMFLPFIMMSLTVSSSAEREFTVTVSFGTEERGFVQVEDSFGFGAAGKTFTVCGEKKICALFGIFHEDSPLRSRFENEEAVSRYGIENYDALRRGVGEFISVIPRLGDEKMWEYTRWYTQAAVMLTKAHRDGNVITMGYNELNQRDSYWTTFMHLMYFPDLERRMIEISAENQSETGKIPTTLLPLIEREYDIDINEYFCLRIVRYYEYYRDLEFLGRHFESYKRSVDFLLSRDRDGDGLPEQESPENPECYWGDWKDVSYVVGRKLAPHFCLLWLAVLKYGAILARALSEEKTAEKYDKLYEKAYETVNKPYSDGGLFLSDHYVETWYDGKLRDHVLEDQTVGVFFGVIPGERIPMIYSALKKNECACGIRETYPYREGEEVWNRGGTYHNGGVWPWLMFCDLAGRYKSGRKEEALELVKTLGYYDLERPGDYRPNEYLDAENGENCGMQVQGWSSAVWAIEYVKRISEAENDKR